MQNNNPLISVIIPVYNVERYLQKCIDSVTNQTYKNLEIILVDDGSPDKCPQICDEYANKDSRIKVIHKPNGGLSSARNAGIKNSLGKYIYFLDSDDSISNDCMEILYGNLSKENADVSIAKLINVYEGEAIKMPFRNNNYEVLSQKEAIFKTISGKRKVEFVIGCNKLYKKSLFNDISFPEGKFHEDEATSWKVFLKCNKVVLSDKITYFYFQRKESITGNGFSWRTFDFIDIQKERTDYFKDDEILFPLLVREQRAMLRDKFYMNMVSEKNNEKFPMTKKDIVKKFRKTFKDYPISIDKESYTKKELQNLYLFKFSPRLYLLKISLKPFLKKFPFLVFIRQKIYNVLKEKILYSFNLTNIRLKILFQKNIPYDKKLPYSLFISHELGGGTNQYTKNFIASHRDLNLLIVSPIKIRDQRNFFSVLDLSDNKKIYYSDFPKFLRQVPIISNIFLSSLVCFKKWNEILDALKTYKEFHTEMTLEYFVHDFHCVCPNYTLIAENQFCNLECEKFNCKLRNWKFKKTINIKNWRTAWFDFFKVCDKITVFSASSKEIILKSYPLEKEKIKIVPHSMDYCNFRKLKPNTVELRIGIVGNISSVAKGLNIVISFLESQKSKNTEIFIVGSFPDGKEIPSNNIHYLGEYKHDDLPETLDKYGINVVFFPSVWPETFSYLVSEVIQMDLPIVAFDIGAQGEKVKKYYKGRIIPLPSSPQEIFKACEGIF